MLEVAAAAELHAVVVVVAAAAFCASKPPNAFVCVPRQILGIPYCDSVLRKSTEPLVWFQHATISVWNADTKTERRDKVLVPRSSTTGGRVGGRTIPHVCNDDLYVASYT